MTIKTERVNTADLRYIAQQTAASVADAAIATALIARGTPLPRQDSNQIPYRLRYSHGYALDTPPGNPSWWTAATVAELKTASEYSATADYNSSGNPATLSLTIT